VILYYHLRAGKRRSQPGHSETVGIATALTRSSKEMCKIPSRSDSAIMVNQDIRKQLFDTPPSEFNYVNPI
jgi:hypothetical protein